MQKLEAWGQWVEGQPRARRPEPHSGDEEAGADVSQRHGLLLGVHQLHLHESASPIEPASDMLPPQH